MLLLFVIGSVLLFGNAWDPDIQTNTVNLETSYYEFKDSVTLRRDDTPVATFTPSQLAGGGLSLYSYHRIKNSFRHTLSFRRYPANDYLINLYTTGIDTFFTFPQIPIRLAFGGEIGIGELKIPKFDTYGTMGDALGGEVHLEFSNYFVLNKQLGNYFIRPTFRQYHFPFSGKKDIADLKINGDGLALAVGVGLQF